MKPWKRRRRKKKCPMASIERNKYLQNHLKTAKCFLGVEESPPAAVWFPPKLLQFGHRQRKPAEAWSLIMIPKCGQGMKDYGCSLVSIASVNVRIFYCFQISVPRQCKCLLSLLWPYEVTNNGILWLGYVSFPRWELGLINMLTHSFRDVYIIFRPTVIL